MAVRASMMWLFVLVPAFAPVARGQVTDQSVRESLRAGVQFLKLKQPTNGNWHGFSDSPGGVTGLCTLALLSAGLPADDPAVSKGLAFLRMQTELQRTYAVALQTMVLCAAEPRKDRFQIQRNVGWLQSAQRKRDVQNGAWGYRQEGSQVDNSNSQFALLALREAERAGAKVTEPTWRRALDYWKRQQKPDGSFCYGMTNVSTGSMTCAGIASLTIASGQVSALDAEVTPEGVKCCGGAEGEDVAIERAIDWLGRNFSVRRNPSANRHYYYYMYALERVGRLAGRRFIGDHDWYREGVEALLDGQDKFDGYWNGDDPIVSTAFAVLFLSKGRRPILIAKLKHQPQDDWNRHGHDVSHLTQYVEKRWRRELTWQVVDWQAATAQDLWQSPVLFLSGRDALQITPAEKASLKQYIEMGGFLFAENCCDGKAFDREFRALMKELFPDSPLRLLPPDHAIWYAEQRVDPKYLRELYGIDACCRTGVVYCYSPDEKSLSCLWELAVPQRSRRVETTQDVQDEINAGLAIGANVVAYATGRELREKLDRPHLVSVLKPPSTHDRASLYVAKLQHNGGSDDAPSALANVLAVVAQQTRLPVATEKRLLSLLDPALPDYPVAFLHGRRSFRWSQPERKALKRFIDNGGVIFADAICANADFAAAFRREMQSIFPAQAFDRIPPEHPMFTRQFHGHDISQVTLLDPRTRARSDDPLSARREKIAPLLEGIEVDGRYVVMFSPYDMSCALENRPSLECRGYTREDAAKIATNIILYAMQQ